MEKPSNSFCSAAGLPITFVATSARFGDTTSPILRPCAQLRGSLLPPPFP